MESRETAEKDSSPKKGSSSSSSLDNQPINISTQCKFCKEDFTEKTIFKHISIKKTCKSAYTKKELQVFKQWSKERNNSNRRTKLKSPMIQPKEKKGI